MVYGSTFSLLALGADQLDFSDLVDSVLDEIEQAKESRVASPPQSEDESIMPSAEDSIFVRGFFIFCSSSLFCILLECFLSTYYLLAYTHFSSDIILLCMHISIFYSEI